MTTSIDAGRTVLLDGETEAPVLADDDLRQTAGASLK
jgi:hypothetical protein